MLKGSYFYGYREMKNIYKIYKSILKFLEHDRFGECVLIKDIT